MKFLTRIKTRIALSFSLLFLAVAVPAIFYAFHEVNIVFEGMYLRQMRVAALSARAFIGQDTVIDSDSLAASLARITSSTAFILSSDGLIVASAHENSDADTSHLLSMPIPPGEGKIDSDSIRHKFARIDGQRFLQVQTELPGGQRLLMAKSFGKASMIMARMREVIFWSSFLGLIALIAVAFWVSANITKPLEELTAQAAKIRQGELPEKTTIVSPDEVGDLAETLNDIVDNLISARQRLSKLETMRREFFAKVRGEMEAPLDIILARLDELRHDPALVEGAAREKLKLAADQAYRLRRLIRTLIEISELEFGEITLELQTFSAGSLIGEIAGQFERRIAEKGLSLELERGNGAANSPVVGDRRLLKVVLENLLANAIDFTDSGFVRIASYLENDGVRIAVVDSGHGIQPELLDRVFERFFSDKRPGIPDADRPGLGLAVAMHIIDAHGQKLEVESTLGTGSKFSFWLPLAPAA